MVAFWLISKPETATPPALAALPGPKRILLLRYTSIAAGSEGIFAPSAIQIHPFLTKVSGLGDIRNIGSGNIGATNVLRTGNKKAASIVLIFDILKGYLPTFYILNHVNYLNNYELIAYMLGSVAIFGHIFPIWLKFNGGKGVATYIGYILAINIFIGLIFIFFWLFIAFLKKVSSLASILSLLLIPFIMLFLTYKLSIFSFFLMISIVLILKHYENIKRLLNNKEPKIKF